MIQIIQENPAKVFILLMFTVCCLMVVGIEFAQALGRRK